MEPALSALGAHSLLVERVPAAVHALLVQTQRNSVRTPLLSVAFVCLALTLMGLRVPLVSPIGTVLVEVHNLRPAPVAHL